MAAAEACGEVLAGVFPAPLEEVEALNLLACTTAPPSKPVRQHEGGG